MEKMRTVPVTPRIFLFHKCVSQWDMRTDPPEKSCLTGSRVDLALHWIRDLAGGSKEHNVVHLVLIDFLQVAALWGFLRKPGGGAFFIKNRFVGRI